MSCPSPLDAATLADYWLALLPAAAEDSVEQHLFECDHCGARLREAVSLVDGIRALAREGSLRMVVSQTFLERATAAGLRLREYAPAPGGSVQCTVTAEDDLLIARLSADLQGAGRVDLCLCDGNGVEQRRSADIPFRPNSGVVVYQESMAFAKAAPTSTMIVRLVAFDEAEGERLLGEYTFNHTRSLPGPGAW
ncbi:MAG: hypothetical protein IH602_07020 [Bryobacteraceae bacterium]|nr:hypothetical protein [Bryobacteraceae bacterium]